MKNNLLQVKVFHSNHYAVELFYFINYLVFLMGYCVISIVKFYLEQVMLHKLVTYFTC